MDHLRRLGNNISVAIPAGENGFTGRECPQPNCEGYFKIELGTGLKGDGLPCHCPYCGHVDAHDRFSTKVSTFDGFRRELCRVHGDKALKVSFQNLEGAKVALLEMFGVDLSAGLTTQEWESAVRSFQKRHLLAHRMGVIDKEYITKTGDIQAAIGRKVGLESDEVREMAQIVGKLARRLASDLRAQIHQ